MVSRRFTFVAASVVFLLFGLGEIASAQSRARVIDDSQMKALSTTIGGANVLPTTRTVQHWFGSTLDPHNGVTYGYNMVGANPNSCAGSACSAAVTADIIPINVVLDGLTFSGEDALPATLASPVFVLSDYGSTPFATAAGAFPNLPAFIRGPGGVLSQGDAGVTLQLQDATMRAQFNKTGSSPYHLRLSPVTHDTITIVVPQREGDAAAVRAWRPVCGCGLPLVGESDRQLAATASATPIPPASRSFSPMTCSSFRARTAAPSASTGPAMRRPTGRATSRSRPTRGRRTSRRGSTLVRPGEPTGQCRTFTRSATRLPNGLTILSSTTPWSRG